MTKKINRDSRWYPLTGYERLYEITKNGQIRRLKNKRLLKPFPKGPYLAVGPYSRGLCTQILIHRLVLLTFAGKSRKPNVNHIDGNPHNNKLSNLEWCTQQENCLHAINILKRWPDNRGERCGTSRLKPYQVRAIRKALATGKRQRQVAKIFNMSISAINHIKQGTTWGHLK